MTKSLFAIATASVFAAGLGLASAQMTTTTTTETWTNDQGTMFRDYSTTKKYSSFTDPSLKPAVGMELPSTVTLYPLPDTIKIQSPDRYRYGMVNNHPVVVDGSSHKIIHVWE